jgi:hypothetical protein
VEFDAGRIRRGEVVAAGGAIVLLAALFLVPWFRVAAPGGVGSRAGLRVSLDGWQALTTTRWVLLLTIAACLLLVLLTVSRRAPAIPAVSSMVTCVLGGVSLLVLVYRIVDHPGLESRVGIYLGLVAVLAIGYGGYLSLRTESSPFGDPRSIETVSPGPARAGAEGREKSTSAGRSGP